MIKIQVVGNGRSPNGRQRQRLRKRGKRSRKGGAEGRFGSVDESGEDAGGLGYARCGILGRWGQTQTMDKEEELGWMEHVQTDEGIRDTVKKMVG